MPGGIIQMAVYGSQDIYLTGTPQITFFKIVYRRHTNFAIESIPQHFIGITNFGREMSSVIEKVGDLMHKVYLEIDLPEVNLRKAPSNYKIDHAIAQRQFDQVGNYYKMVREYIAENTKIIRQLHGLLRTNNVSMEEIDLVMSNDQFIGKLENMRIDLQKYIMSDNLDFIEELCCEKQMMYHDVLRINIKVLYWSICDIYLPGENPQTKRIQLGHTINKHLYGQIKKFYLPIHDLYSKKQKILSEQKNFTYVERYKSAWVEEIGNAIIDQIEVRIGPQLMDRHTGDWMILYNNITLNEYQRLNYNKLIGQVPQLIRFDDNIKPRYKLIIPILFWFSKFNGLALPLVALRYHDVMFTLRLKNLSDVFYVEDTDELFDIPNIQSQYDINIQNAVLYVDYIFLDSDERRRFAQSTHEYLIETVQFNEFNNIEGTQTNTHLTFAHPCKYMIFFCQPNQYRANPTGSNKPQWNNFGTRPDKNGQTVNNLLIRLNYTDITDKTVPVIYFNYAQPYMFFRHSPTDGQYVYSFGIAPMEIQPSGTANFSRLDDVSIEYVFSKEFLNLVNSNIFESDGIPTGIYIATYVASYNILRIMSGMAGLAFQTST